MADPRAPRDGVVTRGVLRVELPAGGQSEQDAVAVEEPLEVRVAGDPLVITMRTPGHDRELALGFLFSEGVIASLADVGSVFHCGRSDEADYGNALDVRPGPGVALSPERTAATRRGTLTHAACGVCGRRTIDDLLERIEPLTLGGVHSAELIWAASQRLQDSQPGFARSGGLHAAAVVDGEGEPLAAHEDVGRHNAVDKALGTLLLTGYLPTGTDAEPGRGPTVLAVSGRVSFEIVQKAAVARIPIVCGVSAPTSLAVDMAQRAGIALAGFVRSGRLNLYAHAERIALP